MDDREPIEPLGEIVALAKLLHRAGDSMHHERDPEAIMITRTADLIERLAEEVRRGIRRDLHR